MSITLSASSQSEGVDAVLRGLIGIYETVFPGRIYSYYLLGSYADGSATAISDIDLMLIFRERPPDRLPVRSPGDGVAAGDRVRHSPP